MLDDPYHQLTAYTLSLGDAEFIHQHVVDAYAAQTATEESKPIGVAFALAGLYLHMERGFTGREVQLAHMRLAEAGGPWPTFPLPPAAARGGVALEEVMVASAGAQRSLAIEAWCRSVWEAWGESRERVVEWLRGRGIVP
jgi:hypothetical protein